MASPWDFPWHCEHGAEFPGLDDRHAGFLLQIFRWTHAEKRRYGTRAMSHFLNTLDQIVHSDSVGMVEGIRRHGQWQIRKLLNLFPCSLPIAGSQLYVDRPGGVAALVNAMGE